MQQHIRKFAAAGLQPAFFFLMEAALYLKSFFLRIALQVLTSFLQDCCLRTGLILPCRRENINPYALERSEPKLATRAGPGKMAPMTKAAKERGREYLYRPAAGGLTASGLPIFLVFRFYQLSRTFWLGLFISKKNSLVLLWFDLFYAFFIFCHFLFF
jgi:hypothetical protein